MRYWHQLAQWAEYLGPLLQVQEPERRSTCFVASYTEERCLQEDFAKDIVVATIGCVEGLAREVLLRRRHDGCVQSEIQELNGTLMVKLPTPEVQMRIQIRRRGDDFLELWVCGVPYVQISVG